MNRALLVGINSYPGNELHGCVNDIEDIAKFLTGKCGFDMKDIRLLSDNRATTKGILDRLQWLIHGAKAGDRIYFHYSGHGAQVATRNPKGEVDGLDEVICPVDFDWKDDHMIRDKDFRKIFSAVPAGVEFVWISDSCHSGGLTREFGAKKKGSPKDKPRRILPPADLAWRIETAKADHVKALTMTKAPDNLNVALISGCKSDQTSDDAFIKGRFNGALTYFLLSELKKASGLSQNLTVLVKKINTAIKVKHVQEPQLEGSASIMAKFFLQK